MEMSGDDNLSSSPQAVGNDATEDGRTAKKEPAAERRIRLAKQALLFITATQGHLNLGMGLSWPNTLASDLQSNNSTLLGSQLQFLDWEMDMTGSMLFIGTLPGFAFGGWLVARLGRRKSLMASALPGVIGWTLISFSWNPPVILLGRFFLGVSYGLLGVACRTYLVEISDLSIRGAASTLPELMKSTGGVIVVGLGMVLPWYYLALISCCQFLLYGLLIVPFIPESPSYLVMKGREGEAHDILRRLRGHYSDPQEEIRYLKEMNEQITAKKGWSVFFKPNVLKNSFIIIGLFVISNFSGTEVIKANALRMLQSSSVSLNKDLSTIFVLLLLLVGIICQTLTIDRIGRKKCLILSLILNMVAYTILGYYVFMQSPHINIVMLPENNATMAPTEISTSSSSDAWAWVPTVCLLVAAFSVTFGVGTIPWMLSVEYFPTNIRSQVMSAINFTGNLLSFISLQLYSPLQALLTPAGLYWSYACFAALGIVYTLLVVRETKGRKIG